MHDPPKIAIQLKATPFGWKNLSVPSSLVSREYVCHRVPKLFVVYCRSFQIHLLFEHTHRTWVLLSIWALKCLWWHCRLFERICRQCIWHIRIHHQQPRSQRCGPEHICRLLPVHHSVRLCLVAAYWILASIYLLTYCVCRSCFPYSTWIFRSINCDAPFPYEIAKILYVSGTAKWLLASWSSTSVWWLASVHGVFFFLV